MTQEEHYDVASYALGVLDERDAARFEDHLIECPQCAYELESFVQVADLLADVDAGAVIAAEESRRDGVVLHNLFGEVKQERRRANSRRLYSLAAAVVVFAMLSIGALFAGGRWFAPSTNAPDSNSAQKRGDASQLDPLPIGQGSGIGGTDLPGTRYSHTDAFSGASLDVGLETKDRGTQISYAISNLTGPRNCRLVVVRQDGSTESLSSWVVGAKGWIAPELMQVTTSTPKDKIAMVQVQEVNADGSFKKLVGAPDK